MSTIMKRVVTLCSITWAVTIAATTPAAGQGNRTPVELASSNNNIPGALVRVTADSPIYVQPDSNREPLRVAKEGSVVKMIRTEGAFAYIEFADPEYPRRYGYILSRFVQELAPPRPTAIDLSVPEARQLSAQERQAVAAPPPTSRDPSLTPQLTPPQAPAPAALRPQPPISFASKSSASRFFAGVGFEGNGIVTDPSGSSTTESGPGFGVVLGYGFSPRWSIYGEVTGATINAIGGGTYGLAHIDVGTRVHFLAGQHRAVPFVQFGISGRGEAAKIAGHTSTASGAGLAFGGGVNIHFVPSLALSTGVSWSAGEFTKFQVDDRDVSGRNTAAVSARVRVGLIWFPSARSRQS